MEQGAVQLATESNCLVDDGCLKAKSNSNVCEIVELDHLTQELSGEAVRGARPSCKQPGRELWGQEEINELGILVENLQLGEIVKMHAIAQESCEQVGSAEEAQSLPPVADLAASCSLDLQSSSNDLWDAESKMQVHDGAFSLVRHLASHLDMGMGMKLRKQSASQWRQRFHLGAKLGDGAQASVYKARAAAEPGPALTLLNNLGCGAVTHGLEATSACSSTSSPICPDFIHADGRQVAIKVFHKARSPSFQKELAALLKIGAHPHVARLLESYQNDFDEDVIILELFDCDLYELYRQWFYHMSALLERLIARIVRQLLLALDYLNTRGVTHRDIKLENIMIYQMEDLEALELKLGDFGWAGMADANGNFELAPKVCGTLWYSPPECSPPITQKNKDPGLRSQTPKKQRICLDPERSDMWSVGVVAYLLHVGQNPFKSRGTGSVHNEEEALHRAATGAFDSANSRWRRLPEDVRDFIQSTLRVTPSERPSPSEALRHPYLRRVRQEFMIDTTFISARRRKQSIWQLMDGFQHLAWLAIARAVSETEIDKQIAASALHFATTCGTESGASSTSGIRYLTELAKELAEMPFVGKAWDQVILLAFRYIDVDADGFLGTKDLAAHLASSVDSPRCRAGARSSIFVQTSDKALAAANVWITRWRSSRRERALGIADLRHALFAHRGNADGTPCLRPGAAPAASQPRKALEPNQEGI